MSKKKYFFALIGIAIISLSMGVAGCKGKESSDAQKARAFEPAIPFKLATFDNKEWSLEAVKGRPVVVNFYASWCGPCKLEAPALQSSYKAFGRIGVEFIGVAVDDTEEGARGFLKEHKITFPAGRDATGEIMKAYQLYGVPKTYIIGKDGTVRYTHSGAVSEEVLAREIRKVL